MSHCGGWLLTRCRLVYGTCAPYAVVVTRVTAGAGGQTLGAGWPSAIKIVS